MATIGDGMTSRSQENRKRFDRLFRKLTGQAIQNPLSASGFKREGKRFLRSAGTVASQVEVDRRSNFDCGFILVRVQTWVCVEGLSFILDPDRLDLQDFMSPVIDVIETQIGVLPGPPVPDIEFRTLRAEDSDADIDAKIAVYRILIADHLLPWLDGFKTAEDVGDYLIDPEPGVGRVRIGYQDPPHHHNDLAHAAACFVVAGNAEKAQAALELMKRKKKGVPKEYEPTRQKHIASIERHIARLKAN
jgi:hypothetical protein